MNRTVITPMIVLFGLLGSVALMAGSDVFTPLIQFVHNGVITPLQAAACLLFTVAGFAACYFLLNLLCSYFVPRMSANSRGSGVFSQTKKTEED
ncbi:MAG: hypothetical protein KKD01_09365 [Proteobacteria bacterium]|nr:hypothetical protein [Pseudomonadota bacterium]MBU1419204.1 hypothetical protein [Pseudomonadota bacterium]MBU1454918.1 hypothetical protein [Pseudomonadota bacterium]